MAMVYRTCTFLENITSSCEWIDALTYSGLELLTVELQ